MNENDLTRFKHMLASSLEVIEFSKQKSRSDLDSDIMLVRALSMSLSIIGEAASKITDEIRLSHSNIPWKQIIGMRNFIIHAYFSVDYDVLWDTVHKSIPPLITQLEKIISNEDGVE